LTTIASGAIIKHPEQTDRAADVLPQGGPHPLPQ
jgi:hypothetical protein